MSIKRKKPRSTARHAASTGDIIGGPVTRTSVPAKWRKHHERLIVLRKQLENSRGELIKDATGEIPAASLHIADAGTDTFDRDFALSRLSSEQDAAYEIDEALTRMRTGGYGFCELTGKPIEPERLEAIPWTRFSKEAENELEKHGEIRRARLAPRGPMGQPGDSPSESSEDDQYP